MVRRWTPASPQMAEVAGASLNSRLTCGQPHVGNMLDSIRLASRSSDMGGLLEPRGNSPSQRLMASSPLSTKGPLPSPQHTRYCLGGTSFSTLFTHTVYSAFLLILVSASKKKAFLSLCVATLHPHIVTIGCTHTPLSSSGNYIYLTVDHTPTPASRSFIPKCC